MPPQRPVPETLRKRPFTRGDAVAVGVSPHLLRGSRFRRLFRGVYVCTDVADTPLLRLDGALLVLPPKAAASHLSAAAVYRLPVPPFTYVHIVVWRGWLESRIDGIRVHEARQPRAIVEHRGYRVTCPARTFVDLGDLLGFVDLVIVGDAMVRLGLCTPQQLVEEAAAARTRRVGVWIARPDLSYPDLRIAIEYDGRNHEENSDQREQDIARQEAYDRCGWRVIVVTAKRFYRYPAQVVARVLAALQERGHPQAPAQMAMAWVAHFGNQYR
jgi:very-short-patch-repair endonuclease